MKEEAPMNRSTVAGTVKSQARRATESVTAIRQEAVDLDRRLRRMAREQPLLVLAMALATGYVVGRIVSRF
jgi:hypothetical protein